MIFSLREEKLAEITAITTEIAETTQSLADVFYNNLHDLTASVNDKVLQDVSNLFYNFASRVIESTYSADDWLESNANFSACAETMHVGEVSVEIAKTHEQKIAEILTAYIKKDDIAVSTENPVQDDEKIQELEQIIRGFIAEMQENHGEFAAKIAAIKESNLLIFSFERLAKDRFTYIEESLDYLPQIVQTVAEQYAEMDRKLKEITEENTDIFANYALESAENIANEVNFDETENTVNSSEQQTASIGDFGSVLANSTNLANTSQAAENAEKSENAETVATVADITALSEEIAAFQAEPASGNDVKIGGKFKKLGSFLANGVKKAVSGVRNLKPETKKLVVDGLGVLATALVGGVVPGAWVAPVKDILEKSSIKDSLKKFVEAKIGLDKENKDDKTSSETDKIKEFITAEMEKMGKTIVDNIATNPQNPLQQQLAQMGKLEEIPQAIIATQAEDLAIRNKVRSLDLPEQYQKFAQNIPPSTFAASTPEVKYNVAQNATNTVVEGYKSNDEIKILQGELDKFLAEYSANPNPANVPKESDFPKLFAIMRAAIKNAVSSLRDFKEIGEVLVIFGGYATGAAIPAEIIIGLAKYLKNADISGSIKAFMQKGGNTAEIQHMIKSEIGKISDNIADDIIQQKGEIAKIVKLTAEQQTAAQRQFSATKQADNLPKTYSKIPPTRPKIAYNDIQNLPKLTEKSPIMGYLSELSNENSGVKDRLNKELEDLHNFAKENPFCAYNIPQNSEISKLLEYTTADLPLPSNVFSSSHLNAEKLSKAVSVLDTNKLGKTNAKEQVDNIRKNLISGVNGYPMVDKNGKISASTIQQVAAAVQGKTKEFSVGGELGETLKKYMGIPKKFRSFASLSLSLLSFAAIPVGLALVPFSGGLSLPATAAFMGIVDSAQNKIDESEKNLLNAFAVSVGAENAEKILRNYKLGESSEKNGIVLVRK
ncbi:MAG: hypothetical protein FWG68_10370 [Defluviitaleaceae bacterium]|nr:hypothetical protein [Defluviitaleaceae bacterium]